MTLFLEALVAWLVMLMIAMIGGVARNAAEPRMGEHRAHQAFTVLTALVMAVLIALFVAWTRPIPIVALGIGVMWLVLTLGFEFGFFYLVRREPLAKLLRDYNLAAGRLWTLVLANLLITPWLCAVYLQTASE